MAKSVQNGNLLPGRSDGLAVGSYPSSDESSSSTVKSFSESPGKNDTSCKDTDFKESSSDTCKPSDDDVEAESSSVPDKKDEELSEVSDSKKTSPETSTPSKEDETGDVSATVSVGKKDDQTETEQATEQPSAKADSYLSDNFADNEDSCNANITKVQAMLENLRDIRTPREVNIGKVINRRRRRKRSDTPYMGGKNSPLESLRQSKRLQRDGAGCSHTQASSDSSQDTRVFEKAIGPTKFSSDLFSKSTSENLKAGEGPSSENLKAGEGPSSENLKAGEGPSSENLKAGEGPSSENLNAGEGPSSENLKAKEGPSSENVTQSSDFSLDCPNTETSDEPQDKKSNPPKDSSNTEVSKSVRRKVPDSLPSTSKGVPPPPLSPLPSTPEDEASSQYASDLLLAENLHGNPHASRVNSLTSLLDRVAAFSDHMEGITLFSDPNRSSLAASGEVPPPLVRVGYRTLRDLHENFRICCDALNKGEVKDEDKASESLITSVTVMKKATSYASDECQQSQPGRRVPHSDERLSIEELRDYLPGLLDSLMSNNMVMNQWTCTLLDWCLKTTPECHPQQFYDTEAGVRSLFMDINELHRSIYRLLIRWNSRRMYSNELADLTYLLSLSSIATSLFSELESEIVNIRFNLGTRHSTRRRRSDSEDNLSDEKDRRPSKKSKKE